MLTARGGAAAARRGRRGVSCPVVDAAAPIRSGHVLQGENYLDLITIRYCDRSPQAIPALPRDSVDVFAFQVAVSTYETPPQWRCAQTLDDLVHPSIPTLPSAATRFDYADSRWSVLGCSGHRALLANRCTMAAQSCGPMRIWSSGTY
jgi:hypothetical protein